jgi:hypothetical protein
VTIEVRVPPEVAEALERVADLNDRSLPEEAYEAIMCYVEH